MSIPVRIKSVQYETLGPIQNYIHPITITEYRTYCTVYLDRGTSGAPAELITGQTEQDQVIGVYVETGGTHDSVYAQSRAYNEALNVINSYGFTIVDGTSGDLAY